MILKDPIETGEQCRDRSCTVAIENAYRDELHRSRYTVSVPADDAGDMGAMTIAVGRASIVVDRVEALGHPATEIGVMRDAGVDDINSHAGSRHAADIAAVQRERA